jgi:hypothetical protein
MTQCSQHSPTQAAQLGLAGKQAGQQQQQKVPTILD